MACWQNEYLSLSTKLEYLINSKCLSDVTFVVGEPPNQKQIPSHKFLLSIYSDELQAMFCDYSKTNNSDHQIINVEDTEVHIFEQMLKFIYTEKIDVDQLPVSDVSKIFHLAEKYNIYPLMFQCLTIMEPELAADNACVVYHMSLVTNNADLTKKCEDIIKNEAKTVLNSKSFMKLPVNVVKKIATFNFLKIPNELFLFDAILNWAKEYAGRHGKTLTVDVLRNILKNILPHIRFLSMTHNELFSSPARSGILQKADIMAIALHKSQPNLSDLPKWCNLKHSKRIENDEMVEKLLRFCHFSASTEFKKLRMKCFIQPLVIDIKLNSLTLCCKKGNSIPFIYINEFANSPQMVKFTEEPCNNSDSGYKIKFVEPIIMKKFFIYYVHILNEESIAVCERSASCDQRYTDVYLNLTYVQNTCYHLSNISFSIIKEDIPAKPIMPADFQNASIVLQKISADFQKVFANRSNLVNDLAKIPYISTNEQGRLVLSSNLPL